ncbi:MAG: right-handed parallel beta-helix repeat-containing protein, partial [Candidatus Eisenbacteria sp.]|nr:right-handed parallel beta-helix repeat-containing protein [Candidatus Eisenbacteria bacterium]
LSNPLDVTVTGCDFLQNDASVYGGGIYLIDATTLTTVTDCHFSGDIASNEGGAIYIDSSPAAFTDCTFSGCSSNDNGGAVCVTGPNPLTFLRCQFDQNSADSGGAIASYELADISLEDCTFDGNEAAYFGGGLSCSNTSLLRATGCDFLGNTARLGGGVGIDSTATSIDSCLFQGNHAEIDGGGMYAHAGDDYLAYCLFWQNTSGRDAAGLLMDSCVADTVRSCTFSANTANQDQMIGEGGGASLREGACFFRNCSFARNVATGGGGLYCYDASCSILGGYFKENAAGLGLGADRLGGAIRGFFSCDIEIVGSIFASDSCADGGALAMTQGGTLDIRNTTMYDNYASAGSASGIHVASDVTGTVERTIISHAPQGEAIECGEDFTLVCCDIYGNAGGDWIDEIADQYGVNGNISEDPLYCNAPAGEYHLHEDSPCAPFSAPNPECDLIGVWPVGCGPASTDEMVGPPQPTLLLRHSPNPMGRTARITYTVPFSLDAPAARVHLAIYDASGRLVHCLVDEEQVAGIHDVSWNGSDSGHQTTNSGVYFCRLQVGSASTVQSVIRIE